MSMAVSTVAVRCARNTRSPACHARRDERASAPRLHLTRGGALGRECEGTHPSTRLRVHASADAASLVPPPELESLSMSSALETVDPSLAHVDEAASVWYFPSFLDDEAAKVVASCCAKLRAKKKMKLDNSFAIGRRSAMVPVAEKAFGVFSGSEVVELLKKSTKKYEFLRCGDYPVEARLYLPGAEMPWHRDISLYKTPQLELIYTVSNDSDARTQWAGSDGAVRSLRPRENSALVFRAGEAGAWHRVVPASQGERTIIKALYCSDATLMKTEAFSELLREAPWRR